MLVKILGWAAKTAAAGLIVSFLSIWTTGYIVNSYLESLLKQYNIPIEVTPFALTGVWGKLWGADPAAGGKGASEAAESGTGGGNSGPDETAGTGGGRANGSGEAPGTRDGGGAGSGSGLGDEEEKGGSDNARGAAGGGSAGLSGDASTGGSAGASGGTSEDTSGSTSGNASGTGREGTAQGAGDPDGAQPVFGGEEAIVSEGDMLDAKSQLSDGEKDELFELLVSKLPDEQLQRISTVMEDGLTEAELIEVQQLVAAYLEREEYDRLMNILKKS